MRCVNFTGSRESAHSYGWIIECRSSYRKLLEDATRPHALISPFWSRKGFRERIEFTAGTGRFWLKQRYSSEKNLRWVHIVISSSAAATSWASRRTRESGDFDIARQIDGHTRGPAMLYLIWESDLANLLLAYTPHGLWRHAFRSRSPAGRFPG